MPINKVIAAKRKDKTDAVFFHFLKDKKMVSRSKTESNKKLMIILLYFIVYH
ncbi:hypothetical protein [Photobacterium sp. R1]